MRSWHLDNIFYLKLFKTFLCTGSSVQAERRGPWDSLFFAFKTGDLSWYCIIEIPVSNVSTGTCLSVWYPVFLHNGVLTFQSYTLRDYWHVWKKTEVTTIEYYWQDMLLSVCNTTEM